jgi:hypothetical protein
MGWILVLAIIVGDIYLYCKGFRPKNSMWRDEYFINQYKY